MTARSLEVRITEYRDNLLSIPDQLEALITQLRAANLITDAEEMESAIRLYRLIADDLTMVISGQELAPFAVTGEMP